MGDRTDGDFRLQVQPKAQGSVRGEVTNENVGQRAVVLSLVDGTCTLPARFANLRDSINTSG